MAQLPVHQPEWIDTAPVVVKRERQVLAPPAAVWKHIADHLTWPQWFKGIKTVQVIGSGEGVGGQRVVSLTGTTVGEVFTAWEPNERFAFAVVTGPRALAGMAESVVIEPDGDGCTVTYTQGIEPAPRFGWLANLASKRMAKLLEKALHALALRAEADHAAGAGVPDDADVAAGDTAEAGPDADEPDPAESESEPDRANETDDIDAGDGEAVDPATDDDPAADDDADDADDADAPDAADDGDVVGDVAEPENDGAAELDDAAESESDESDSKH